METPVFHVREGAVESKAHCDRARETRQISGRLFSMESPVGHRKEL